MRIVVKIGSSSLTYESGRLNIRHFEEFVKVLSDIKNAGHEIILVSSGAIAMGVGKLNLSEKPDDIPGKQAAAAIGQCELMYEYDKQFSLYNQITAQILLTADDFLNETKYSNLKNTIRKVIEMGALPIVNENDTVATDEIRFGDNDTLAANVACAVDADMLVLMSDIDGLYTADPHVDENAVLIPTVTEINAEIENLAGGIGSALASGGMKTKISAARIAMSNSCDMVITNGSHPENLYDIVDGKAVGTKFIGRC